MPSFPHIKLPDVDLPQVDRAELDARVEQLTAVLRDVAYAGVGFAVMTAERIRDWQQQMFEQLEEQLNESGAQVRNGVETVVNAVTDRLKS
jgi:hypothetical protein